MKTAKEAATLLGVSPRRIRALIDQGVLEAEKVGMMWLIDEKSLYRHAKSVKKKGGRPKKGSASHEHRFTLMNREHQIASIVYDETIKEFSFLGEIVDKQRAPLGLSNFRNSISLTSFNGWWRDRGIPAKRTGIAALLKDAGVDIPFELSVNNLGLSLSDQYWICPEGSSLQWDDINFFHNDFETTKDLKSAHADKQVQEKLLHPDNTSDGVLPKHWVIIDGDRRLHKAGIHNDQEPYNEVVATALYRRLLEENDYVPYHLDTHDDRPVSSCSLFLSDKEEFIPALQISKIKKQAAHHNLYQHYLECCNELGITESEDALARMIICDDIIANTDRHWRNFGVIRNVETLSFRMAPIFDSGTSLWCTKSATEVIQNDYRFESKQFYSDSNKQFMLVSDVSWIDIDALDGFLDEAYAILNQNPSLENRLPFIMNGLERRVERIMAIKQHL